MPSKLKVAVLFESSGIVRDAFIALGHDAISCDLKPSEQPGPHITDDVFAVNWSNYDLIIAHPPCTFLAVSGNRYYAGTEARAEAAYMVSRIWSIPCDHMVLENPVGQINYYLPHMPRPQYIQPYEYGHDASKKTGLWLRNLPPLKGTSFIPPGPSGYYSNQTPTGQNKLGPSPDRATIRSRTYPGIAEAMALQWSNYILKEKELS